jgi:glucokinase
VTANCLGIDIGGTAIKLGLVGADGRVLARSLLSFERDRPLTALCDALADACLALEAQAGLHAAAIGVATPGFTDTGTGILVDGGGNVPALREGSLRDLLAARLRRRVTVENDGTAAALGELRHGAGRDFRRFALVTIGTGIGGGVVIDGRVVTGNRGEPAELGALVLDAEGPPNRLGLPGTFEHYAGLGAFQAAYAAHGGGQARVEVATLFGRAGQDAAAAAAIETVCRRIAQGLGILINAFNLEACLIGGGISAAGEPLLAPVRKQLPSFTWPMLLGQSRILCAALGNEAGLVGAASRAMEGAAANSRVRAG